ncbi:Rz-like spanin [Escherichia phage EcS1]|uniref:I-spanin n=1 Tax=Escherichia phage EcS1 TaxID=2083276 RepID=A0A2Z5ZCX8_9CAUD|nr:Rz-like spanin [Escherichia phage EcS1]BBC78292.1 I-spanin [Escherichia phage EcS1]
MLLILGVLSVFAFVKIQEARIDNLKESLTHVEQTVKEQDKQITDLKDGFTRLSALDDERKANRLARDTSDAKMFTDAKRSDTVAKKPKLVEKQINDSFNKFAQDMQEATR